MITRGWYAEFLLDRKTAARLSLKIHLMTLHTYSHTHGSKLIERDEEFDSNFFTFISFVAFNLKLENSKTAYKSASTITNSMYKYVYLELNT